MPTFRQLRCANAHLYIAATLIVTGAAIYVICCKDTRWQQIAAVLAAIVTPAWAAYYAWLRITISPIGITRRSLTGTTSITWAELTDAQLTETRTRETESCTITLQSSSVSIRISSELFPLEEVQELARELRKCKLLHS